MDLKDTIDNTNKHKNNLKLAKEKINNKLIESGGVQALNLIDVSNKIEEMLKYYKKTAIGTIPNVHIAQKEKIFILPMNLSFIPKKILLYIENIKIGTTESSKDYSPYILDSEIKNKQKICNVKGNGVIVQIQDFNQTTITLEDFGTGATGPNWYLENINYIALA